MAPTPDARLERALEHCRAREWAQAEAACREVLAERPQDGLAMQILGRIALAVGNPGSAVQLLSRAASLEPAQSSHVPFLATAFFDLGRSLQAQGNAQAAVECYGKAIGLRPDYADACNNLGVAQRSLGQLAEAIASYRRAIEVDPASAIAYNNLGIAFQEQGRFDEAIAACRRAIELKPDYAEAHSNLGASVVKLRRFEEAVGHFETAVRLNPRIARVHLNLALAYRASGRLEDAIAAFGEALRLDPQLSGAYAGLGLALQQRGQLSEALEHCNRAVALNPLSADAHRSLGVVLLARGQLPESIASLRRAVLRKPDYGEGYNDLAAALQARGDIEGAVEAARRAVAVDPTFPAAWCSLALALGEIGLIDEAIDAARKAIELHPAYEEAYSVVLFFLNYSTRHDAAAIFEAHRGWAKARADGLAAPRAAHPNPRKPARRLRVGYVSADFRQHSVAFFIAPILANHDAKGFEVVCYSDVQNPDGMTRLLQQHAHRWRDVIGLSHEQLASLIQEDGIDILVDLAVHSGSNRLLTFARKPAPVQVTYLGYAGTTGLEAMDYKLTDAIIDPQGRSEASHSEKLLRLASGYFCYWPPRGCPDVAPAPVASRGAVTFAGFQNLAKVSAPTVEIWARLLTRLPDARLVLKARGLGGATVQERLRAAFARHGVKREQLLFEDFVGLSEYLARFSGIDIALDTTPFNGGTTTCHSLWMGVPVVTLSGAKSVGRVGASILTGVGLSDLIAANADEYVEIATQLARDTRRLARLRSELRKRMSPIMDGAKFTRELERAYRRIWRDWCAGKPRAVSKR